MSTHLPTVAVDAHGGDDAPEVVIRGAAEASKTTQAKIVLVGEPDTVRFHLDRVEHEPSRIDIVPAQGAIPMGASPKKALEEMPNASLPRAAGLVAEEGGAQALVSAGNTGAVVLTCAQRFRLLQSVRRAGLAAVIPTEQRRGDKDDPFALLLDAGATLRVKATDLVAFGVMGSAYAQVVSRNDAPRVALLSNGSEPNKGTPEVVEAHGMLKGIDHLNFVGNIEGVDIPRGGADVILCEGFTGNITLKMLEGVSETVMELAKYAVRSRMSWRFAMWLLSNGIRQLKDLTDWQQYGGAPILGFDRLCIKAHGRSGPRAIRNAIRVAERCVRAELVEQILRRMPDPPSEGRASA